MRKSTPFFLVVCAELLVAAGFGADATARRASSAAALERTRQVVARLGLTDLALFTEARYTRHLSQTDLASAYQDHPVSLEHFPSGSLAPRPPLSTGGAR